MRKNKLQKSTKKYCTDDKRAIDVDKETNIFLHNTFSDDLYKVT